MNYTVDQVMTGIINYADSEIMGKLPTSGKWIMGTAIGLATTKTNNIVDALRENAIAKMLGIIDDNGNVDVDALIGAMRQAADKYGKVSFDIPMIGTMTFSASDVDRLRTFIV